MTSRQCLVCKFSSWQFSHFFASPYTRHWLLWQPCCLEMIREQTYLTLWLWGILPNAFLNEAACCYGVTDGFTKSIRNTCNCFLKAVGVYFQGILCSAVTWRHFCNWISDSSPFDDSILCYSVANYMLSMSYLCNVQHYSISTCQFCFNICGLFDRVPFKGW